MKTISILSMALVALLAGGCGGPEQGNAPADATPPAAPTNTPGMQLKSGANRVEVAPPATPPPMSARSWSEVEQEVRQLQQRTEDLLENPPDGGWRGAVRSMGQVQASHSILVHQLAELEPADEEERQRLQALRAQSEVLLRAYAAMLDTVTPAPTPAPTPEEGEEEAGEED